MTCSESEAQWSIFALLHAPNEEKTTTKECCNDFRLLSGGPPKGLQTDLDHRLSESAERREDFTAAQSIEECVSSEPPEVIPELFTFNQQGHVLSSGNVKVSVDVFWRLFLTYGRTDNRTEERTHEVFTLRGPCTTSCILVHALDTVTLVGQADGNLVTPDEELAGARDAEVISSGAADAHAPSPDTAGESDPHGGGDTSDSVSSSAPRHFLV